MASKAKKTTALLLASLMCVGAFAGCGGNGNNGCAGGAYNPVRYKDEI